MVTRLRKHRSASKIVPEPGSWHAVALRCALMCAPCWCRRAVECWEMESRLKVHASARFPLFEPLLWHTVARYRQRLLAADLAGDSRPTPTAWELTGLMSVLSFLKGQMDRGDWFYCPTSIDNPKGK